MRVGRSDEERGADRRAERDLRVRRRQAAETVGDDQRTIEFANGAVDVAAPSLDRRRCPVVLLHAADARQAGFDYIVNCMPVSAIPKAHVTGMTDGVIKMIADRTSGRLLGVHLVCHRGADMINEAALALRMRATVTDIAATMHVYPSIGEGLKLCAQGFSRDITLLSCCAE